jgi:hypothetical protein
MPKDKVKGGVEAKLAKAATRTPLRTIETALSAGFGGAIIPGLLSGSPQWNLNEQQSRPLGPPKAAKEGKRGK